MLSNRLAFALLGLVCVAAAGGGAYVATRQNAPDRLALPVAEAVPTPGQPVETTEATLDDLPPAAPVAPESPVPFRAPSAKRTSPVAEPRPRDVSPKAATPASPRTAKPASSSPSPDRTAPSSAPAATETPAPVPIASVPSRVEELRPVEPARLPQEAPAPAVRELVVSADSVLGLQLARARRRHRGAYHLGDDLPQRRRARTGQRRENRRRCRGRRDSRRDPRRRKGCGNRRRSGSGRGYRDRHGGRSKRGRFPVGRRTHRSHRLARYGDRRQIRP
jgi:hypothetical protein